MIKSKAVSLVAIAACCSVLSAQQVGTCFKKENANRKSCHDYAYDSERVCGSEGCSDIYVVNHSCPSVSGGETTGYEDSHSYARTCRITYRFCDGNDCTELGTFGGVHPDECADPIGQACSSGGGGGGPPPEEPPVDP